MVDKGFNVGVPGFVDDGNAGAYPPFKSPEESGATATGRLAELQLLDSRGVAQGTPLHPTFSGQVSLNRCWVCLLQGCSKTQLHQQPRRLVGLSSFSGKVEQNGMPSSQQHLRRSYPLKLTLAFGTWLSGIVPKHFVQLC